ncbi:MAG: cytochrome c [Chloroflexi bacterium]|nr:cytochrome c [Chloroflexota bacterium]
MAGAALIAACGSVPAGAAPSAPPVPTLGAQQVRRGREVYVQYCATCHGPEAKGAANWQQPDARGNLPAPPHDDSGHTWRHPDAQLEEIIRNGQRDRFNKTPELTMPPFKDQLSDAEIAAVIAYFKSLWSAEHRRFQEEQNQRGAMDMPPAAPAARPVAGAE